MIDRYSRPAMKQIWSDESKYDKWLRIELAVCEAWAKAGVIPNDDMIALRKARYNIVRIGEIFERTRHDMTAFLGSITEGLGTEGRWLHLGLTSSDIMDTALSLQLKEASDLILEDMGLLLGTLKSLAIKYKDTLIMGRTHGVHAEPTTFGLKIALWWDEVQRQYERMLSARNSISVGKISGAVGTHALVTPSIEEEVCYQLGLGVAPISNQILQRDRHAHLVTTFAMLAGSLEKFATEIRGLQRTEVREVEEPFMEGQTGSSAMPHKRNPELSERVCGLARLIRGFAFTAMENVALWHERDISHSSAERVILPDSCLALDYILDLSTTVLQGMRVHPDRMSQNIEATKGLVFSQSVLIALIDHGMEREKAYKLIQGIAMKAWDEGADFRDLLRRDSLVTNVITPNTLERLFDYKHFVKHVNETLENAGLL